MKCHRNKSESDRYMDAGRPASISPADRGRRWWWPWPAEAASEVRNAAHSLGARPWPGRCFGRVLHSEDTMSDLTTKVLIEIRDEIRATRTELSGRIDATNARIDATNTHLGAQLKVLGQRQTESDVRLGTELAAVRHGVDQVVDLLRADRTLRHDVDDLKERVANLERKTG